MSKLLCGAKWLGVITAFSLVCTSGAAAQQPEATNQVDLQQPGAADAIRARIASSGLGAEEIRRRLQAAGYSPTLLDQYLTRADSGRVVPPNPAAQAALDALTTQREQPVGAMAAIGNGGQAAARAPSNVFGVDVFRRTTTQFQPLLSGPVPDDYRLGPNDVLVLVVTGDVELALTLPITRDGFVVIPQVGQVFLSNMTLAQAKDVVRARLARIYSGIRPNNTGPTKFDLVVANVRATQVYVVGEATQPGAYQISALGTVMTALYAAGGITERANLRGVVLRKRSGASIPVDLYGYLLRGDTRADVALDNGDLVFIPPRSKRARITGAVVRPMVYDLGPRDGLADLIGFAGGLQAGAAGTRVAIYRVVPAARQAPTGPQHMVIDVPFADSAGIRVVPSVPLEDGDSVVAFHVDPTATDYVDVKGSVLLPGRFGIGQATRLSGVIRRAGGFRTGTYLGRAHIERLFETDSIRSLISVKLPEDSLAPWSEDPVLRPLDIVTVYNRVEMRDVIPVTISGVVTAPGSYQWRSGMTLRDLVLIARGLRPGALLDYAEIARLPVDRRGGRLADIIRAPMDSTFLFDRDSGGVIIGPPGLPGLARGAPDTPIRPYDNVLVLSQPEFELQRTVGVFGEVKFPGSYSLATKTERIAGLLTRAGGLTSQAYAGGIQFFRRFPTPEGRIRAERINLDLAEALRHPASRSNVILQPGDSMFVPEYQPSVRVVGGVNSPGNVLWVPGKPLAFYVLAAGGFVERAIENRTSVTQANGEVQTRAHGILGLGGTSPTPRPGSTVFVPVKEPNLDHTDKITKWGAITSILASSVAIIGLALRL